MSVSVCLPVFNGEKTIAGAIESVLSQTHRDLELLVWDDGSTDRTFEIASRYDVRLFRSSNLGVARARNHLLGEAKHEFIALIDHDDTWLPHKLELQLPRFDDAGVVLAHANCSFIGAGGEREVREVEAMPPDDPFGHVLPDNRIITSSVVFRREALTSRGGFVESSRCSDWQGWFEIAQSGNFVYDPQVLVEYAVRSESLANSGFKFHEAQFHVLSDFVLAEHDRLFQHLSDPLKSAYVALAKRSCGVALSSMSSCKWKDKDRRTARALAFQALVTSPSVFRVWTRAFRAFSS